MGKNAGASFVTIGLGSTVSFAPAAPRKAAMTGSVAGMPVSVVAFARLGGGRRSFGGVVSRTATVKLTVAEFPWESEALQVTVVEPSPKVAPLGGRQQTGTGPSTSSTAVGAT